MVRFPHMLRNPHPNDVPRVLELLVSLKADTMAFIKQCELVERLISERIENAKMAHTETCAQLGVKQISVNSLVATEMVDGGREDRGGLVRGRTHLKGVERGPLPFPRKSSTSSRSSR